MTRYVRIRVDSTVPPGVFEISGVRLVPGPLSDEQLGREIRTTHIRVHDTDYADVARAQLATEPDIEILEEDTPA